MLKSVVNTKIICTIGPVSESPKMLKEMYNAGMNIARFNMSHGDHQSHGEIMDRVHELNKHTEFPVGIMLDTKGPEIRTGDSTFDLKMGDMIQISVEGPEDPTRDSLYIGYTDLIDVVNIGDKITIDNGIINLEVMQKEETTLDCLVIDGGFIKGRRHVNLPGKPINLPAITDKDKSDILFGLKKGIDFIALSFVRNADNIRELKKLMGNYAGKVKIIAKIESKEGVENLEGILKESDGIMVARGDLGVEIDIEDLPHVQRQIARLCGKNGKRVIVATHLLESMIENPIPTRAEVTDVTNAIYEEVDAVMLSGESTVGKHPIKCLEYLTRIAKKTEAYPGTGFAVELEGPSNKKQNIAKSAVELARHLECQGLMVLTKSGHTSECVSNCRFTAIPTYALTNDKQTYRTMTLHRSILPFLIEFDDDPEKTIAAAFDTLKAHGVVKSQDQLVIISDMQTDTGLIETIQIRRLP